MNELAEKAKGIGIGMSGEEAEPRIKECLELVVQIETALANPQPDDIDPKVVRNRLVRFKVETGFESVEDFIARVRLAGQHAGLAQWLNGFITAIMLFCI
jgi:hypothetical protein